MSNTIQCHQFLFGYDDGHSLLAGSRPLSTEERSKLLSFSDLVPDRAKNTAEYWTGLPLPSSNSYALMKTWVAPEMPRPGCVWTHAMILDQSQLLNTQLLRPPEQSFKRPEITEGFDAYRQVGPLVAPPSKGSAIEQLEEVIQLVRIFYGPKGENYTAYSDAKLDCLFKLWTSSHSSRRGNISFRTAGVAQTRSKTERSLDLRLVDSYEAAVVEPRDWEILVANKVIGEGSAHFGSFAQQLEKDIVQDRNTMRFLAQLYLRLGALSSNGSDWFNLLKIIENALPGPSGESVRMRLLDPENMEKFGLSTPSQFGLLEAIFHEFEEDYRVSSIYDDVPWKHDEFQSVSTPGQDILLKSFVSVESKLPAKILQGALSFFGKSAIRISADEISESTQAAIANGLVKTAELSSFDLSSPVVRKNLASLVTSDASLLNDLIDHLLESEDQGSVEVLTSRLPEPVINRSFTILESRSSPDKLFESVVRILRAMPRRTVLQKFHRLGKNRLQLLALIQGTNASLEAAHSYSSRSWAQKFVDLDRSDLRMGDCLTLKTYLLAIALSAPKPSCEPIFENCFLDVHDAWASGALSSELQASLKRAMSPRPFWTWDWCQALSEDVGAAYVEVGLDQSSINRFARDCIHR